MIHFINNLSHARRIRFLIAVLFIVAVSIGLWIWSTQSQYALLYGQLTEQQAGTVIENLEKLKIDYRIADSGASILVNERELHRTRIQLASSGVPMSGNVGFELFDNVDYGLTEFSQKILLQRALQGELARTITSIDEVRMARVHIVLGENGLFKESAGSKAAVTVILEKDRTLTEQQVVGIQQLVASAVSELDANNVTVSDSRGLVLSTTRQPKTASVDSFIDAKSRVENDLTEKINTLLLGVYGVSIATVKVNVDLNVDKKHSELQEIVPLNNSSGKGFLVRDKTSRTGENNGKQHGATPTSTSLDKTYDYGKRTERVDYGVGQIKRITVSIVVPRDETPERIAQLTALVAGAIGLDENRQDSIEIHPLSDRLLTDRPLSSDSDNVVPVNNSGSVELSTDGNVNAVDSSNIAKWSLPQDKQILMIAGVVLFAAITLIVMLARRTEPRTLSDDERQRLLLQVRNWLAEPEK